MLKYFVRPHICLSECVWGILFQLEFWEEGRGFESGSCFFFFLGGGGGGGGLWGVCFLKWNILRDERGGWFHFNFGGLFFIQGIFVLFFFCLVVELYYYLFNIHSFIHTIFFVYCRDV